MNEPKSRGVEDVLIAIVNGLKRFSEMIEVVFPQVQTYIVHLIRHALTFVSYKDCETMAAALKQIYRAKDADTGKAKLDNFSEGLWRKKYPVIDQSWRWNWREVISFFAFLHDVRRIIYTTNAVKSLNTKLRRPVNPNGHFSQMKVTLSFCFLVLNLMAKEREMPPRERAMANAQFDILFEERFRLV